MDGSSRRGGWLRAIAAGLACAVAVVSLILAVVGAWTMRTAMDSEGFENKVEEVMRREDVSQYLAAMIVTDISDAVDLRDRVAEFVPAPLEPAVEMLLAGARARVEDQLAELIRSDRVNQAIGAAAGLAHQEFVDLVKGDGLVEGVTVENGTVRVNLLPLYVRGFELLQGIGLFDDVVMPEIDRTGDPAEQRAEIEAALGRDLPDDFGEPIVYESATLDRAGDMVELAQRVLVLAQRAVWVLAIGGVLLAAVGLWLANERLRTAAFMVAGLFSGILLIRIVADRAVANAREAIVNPAGSTTIGDVLASLEDSLNETLLTFGLVALVVFGLSAWAVLRSGD